MNLAHKVTPGFLVALSILGFAGPIFNRAQGDTFGAGASAFEVEFVTIGNPGNVADPRPDFGPVGSVSYVYRISKYEISESMFYKANELGDLGVTGSDRGPNKPVSYVSWFSAAKFVNWLNTSTGNAPAYKFVAGEFQLWLSSDPGYDSDNLFRNRQAKYFLPTDNEWHKAAYYNPATGTYFLYPTASDFTPTPVLNGTIPNTAVFLWNHDLYGPTDITQAGGLSAYGTMAQGGNVHEWLETAYDLTNSTVLELRNVRGGDYDAAVIRLQATNRKPVYPGYIEYAIGIRVASISLPPAAPGDFNGDGFVDATDLQQFIADFGRNGNSDANGDGDSDGADVLIWQRRLEVLPAVAAVPEPRAVALLLSLGLPALARRRFAVRRRCAI